MQEIIRNIYIGNQEDYENNKNEDDFVFINACKEPYHRQALGYNGRSCDNQDKEYLFAYRDNNKRLICNLVDVPNVEYISPIIIDECMIFIYKNLLSNKKILINCNKGESRSAIIGMLFLATIGYFKNMNFIDAENLYKNMYNNYNPAKGMKDYAINNWNKYNIIGE